MLAENSVPTSLETNFRKLRESWFNHHLLSCAHERMWENEEEEKCREEQNAELKRVYDEDTEALISGHNRKIDPTCRHDINRSRAGEGE